MSTYMGSRFGWCSNPGHTRFAHYESTDCESFTIWASQALPVITLKEQGAVA